MAWTRFMDMYSGGSQKCGADYILIEAKEEEAVEVFEKRFDRNPFDITCECCGPDFYVSEYDEKPTMSADSIVIDQKEINEVLK